MGHFDQLPLELVLHILSFLSWQEHLNLEHVSRRWREAVQHHLGHLRHFRIGDADLRDDVISEALQELLPRLTSLRALSVELLSHVRKRGRLPDLSTASRHWPELAQLTLRGVPLEEGPLQKLCGNCPRLAAVTLPRGCVESCAEVVVRGLPALRALGLSGTGVTGRCFARLPGTLRELSVADGQLSSGHLRQLARCEQLRHLDLSNARGLAAADLAAGLAGCRRLERLTATALELPLSRCLPPAGLPALRHLDISRSLVTDEDLQQLPTLLPRLETVTATHCMWASQRGLDCLCRLPALRALNLAASPGVTDWLLDRLHDTGLVELQLGGCSRFLYGVTPEGLMRLVLASRALRTLTLWADEELVESVDCRQTPERDLLRWLRVRMLKMMDMMGWSNTMPADPH